MRPASLKTASYESAALPLSYAGGGLDSPEFTGFGEKGQPGKSEKIVKYFKNLSTNRAQSRSAKILNLLIAIFLFFCFLQTSAHAQKLVVLGEDGAGLPNVAPMLEEGRLPNLKILLDNGGTLLHLEPLTSTYTIPNWTVAWTGLTPDVTGVGGNVKWKPSWSMNLHRSLNIWTAQVPYSWTILKTIQDKGAKIGWFISKPFLGTDKAYSPLTNIGCSADGFLEKRAGKVGDEYLEILTDAVCSFIQANSAGDFLIFLHLNPDHYGHKYGENSERYLQEFIRCDGALGRIVQILPSDCKVAVMSDHGFDEGLSTHDNAPDNFLATNLPLDQKWVGGGVTMRDFANTVLAYFGLPNSHAKMHGKSLLK